MNVLRITRILTLVVIAYGVTTPLVADGSVLKKYYTQCGLHSPQITRKLCYWDTISGEEASIDSAIKAIQQLSPCKKCKACLCESQNAVRNFFVNKFVNSSLRSDNFEKVYRSFIFQQVKNSCKYHGMLRRGMKRNALRNYDNKELRDYNHGHKNFCMATSDAIQRCYSPDLQEISEPEILDPFKRHKKNFRPCLQDIKFIGFEKEYQACLDQEKLDQEEWEAMLEHQRNKFFGWLLEMYISSQDPYTLDSYILESAFHLLSSVNFFEWTKKHCHELINSEQDLESFQSNKDQVELHFDGENQDDEFEDIIDFNEFLEWCEWILDTIDFIRADLGEVNFENEPRFEFTDCLSSQDDLLDENDQTFDKSFYEDEISFVDPKSKGKRNYKNKKRSKNYLKI